MSKMKTQEVFLKEVYDTVKDEYEVLSDYSGNKSKVIFKHTVCGNIYETTPTNFFRGYRCSKCNNRLKKSTEQFKLEVCELTKSDYSVLEDYLGSKIKIKFRHNKCGHEFLMRPNNFLTGERCPKCARNNKEKRKSYMKSKYILTKRDTEYFKDEIYQMYKGEYILLSEYKTRADKVKMLHATCGHTYEVSPNNFLRNRKCPKCAIKLKASKKKMTHEEFVKCVQKERNGEFLVLSNYETSLKKVKVKHLKCNNVYEITPNNLLRGRNCPKCSKENATKTLRKTHNTFIDEVYCLVKDEYSVVGEYTNSKTKVKILHNNCGNTWSIQPNSFLGGVRCPKCSSSLGEKIIESHIKNLFITQESQYKFEECKYERHLLFDSFVNGHFLVEFDGEQHFRSIDFFGGKEGFKHRRIKDEIKNTYCINNKIPLIRIPYWEIENIPVILNNFFHYFGIIKMKDDDFNLHIIKHYLVDENWCHDTYLKWNYKKYRPNII